MKAQTKALLASVVVIALALSAVSGITYSWWSDSEQAEITVNTGYVDVTTSGFSIKKGGVLISGTPDSIPSTMGITFQDSEESTAWDSSSSSLMIRDDTSEVITITYAATFSWSVASKYNMDFETTSVALDDVTDMTINSGAILRGEWMHVTGTGTRSYNVVIEIGGLPSNLTNAKVSIQNHITQEKSDVGQWSGGTTEPISLSSGGQYLIYNASQLAWVAQQVNGGYMTFKDSTVKLMDNIDLGGYEWEPIGNAYDTAVDPHDLKTFQGIFDGNGKAITGLNVDISSGKDNNYAAGLFGWFGSPGANAKVENLVISGARVSGHHDVGGIVGYLYDGAISDCTVKDSVITNTWEDAEKGGDKTGGIVGFINSNEQYSQIITGNTIKNVTIEGCRDIGGIAGIAYVGNVFQNNTIEGENEIILTFAEKRDEYNIRDFVGRLGINEKGTFNIEKSNVTISEGSVERVCLVDQIDYLECVLDDIGNGTDPSLNGIVIRLTDDLSFTSSEDNRWHPGRIDQRQNCFEGVEFTIDGNGHSISGLDGALLPSVYNQSQSSKITIMNLELKDCSNNIARDGVCLGTERPAGMFINEVGGADMLVKIVIEGCKVSDSNVGGVGFAFAGGFIGYVGENATVSVTGSSSEDGLSVVGTKITAGGSVGGVVGHAAGIVVIEGAIVQNNDITTIGYYAAEIKNDMTEVPDENKVGTMIGTVNCNGCRIGGCTASNNTLKCGTVTLGDQNQYGRIRVLTDSVPPLILDGAPINGTSVNSRGK